MRVRHFLFLALLAPALPAAAARPQGELKQLTPLGAGRHAWVYSAVDEAGESYAVKLNHLDGRADERATRAEADTLAALQGLPHALEFHGVREFKLDDDELREAAWSRFGHTGIVTELIKGEQLWQLDGLSQGEVVQSARDLLDHLGAMRTERGLHHGDVHLGNILRDDEGRTTLIDYGLAVKVGEAHPYGDVGLPARAPEGWSAGADCYALATAIAARLSGRDPFGSGERRVSGAKALAWEWRRATKWIENPGLRAVFSRALDPDASARFQSEADFSAALAPYVGLRAKVAKRAGALAKFQDNLLRDLRRLNLKD